MQVSEENCWTDLIIRVICKHWELVGSQILLLQFLGHNKPIPREERWKLIFMLCTHSRFQNRALLFTTLETEDEQHYNVQSTAQGSADGSTACQFLPLPPSAFFHTKFRDKTTHLPKLGHKYPLKWFFFLPSSGKEETILTRKAPTHTQCSVDTLLDSNVHYQRTGAAGAISQALHPAHGPGRPWGSPVLRWRLGRAGTTAVSVRILKGFYFVGVKKSPQRRRSRPPPLPTCNFCVFFFTL